MPDGFHGREERLGFEHHAFAAAEGPVVDGPVAVEGPVAQVVNADIQKPGVLAALHHAMRERSHEKLGEDRQHMEDHVRFKSFKPSGNSTAIRRAAGSISTQMERAKGINRPPSTTRSPDRRRPPNR